MPRRSKPRTNTDPANQLLVALWSSYLVIAPVFWLPGISPELLSGSKQVLFAVAVFASLLIAGTIRVSGRFGIEGFGLVALLSTPAILQANSVSSEIRWYYGLALAGAAIAAFNSLPNPTKLVLDAAFGAGIGLAILSLAIVGTYVSDLSLTSTVGEFTVDLATNGFSLSRTEWSNGVALFTPVLFLRPTQSTRVRTMGIVAGLAIGCGQFIVGGRTGLGLTVLAAVVALAKDSRFKLAAPVFVFVVLVIATLGGGLETPESLRRAGGDAAVEAITTGRSAQWTEAVDRIIDRPIRGTGFGSGTVSAGTRTGELVQIHNLWLRLAVEGGVALPLAIVAGLVMLLLELVRRHGWAHPMSLVITGGLLMSLVEPSAPLGAFNKTVLFWCCIGASVSLLRTKKQSKRRKRAVPQHRF